MEMRKIKRGETLLSIAAEAGFRDWRSIWEHDANRDLRKRRSDPQVLAEGDELWIPDKSPRPFSVETEKRHKFKLAARKAVFSIILRDDAQRPYAGHKYSLTIEGRKHEGVTAADGRIMHPVEPTDRTGELTLWRSKTDPEDKYTWRVALGGLDPIDSITGVQARLNNLGFRHGPIDGTLDDATKAAVRAFQQTLGRENPSGEIDEETKRALLAREGR